MMTAIRKGFAALAEGKTIKVNGKCYKMDDEGTIFTFSTRSNGWVESYFQIPGMFKKYHIEILEEKV